MEQSKTRNHRARDKTRASLLSDKGLDAANHNPRFRRREKNVLDIPSYRTGVYTQNPVAGSMSEIGIYHQLTDNQDYQPTAAKRSSVHTVVASIRLPEYKIFQETRDLS
jgi:hypothetical protein